MSDVDLAVIVQDVLKGLEEDKQDGRSANAARWERVLMMHDQADELRALARRAQYHHEDRVRPPRRVLVTTGTAGAGATSIALALSAYLAKQGSRVVLLDAATSRPDATRRSQLDDHETVADVMTGRRGIHEVLRPGPAGFQIIPGAWGSAEPTAAPPSALQRLTREIDSLSPHCDVTIIDGGAGLTRLSRKLWQLADTVLLITTDNQSGVMDAYAAIKIASAGGDRPHVLTVMNRCTDAAIGAEWHRRISQAAQRFLALPIGCAATIPNDFYFSAFPNDVATQPRWETTVALDHIAAAVLANAAAGSPHRGACELAA